MNTKTMISLKMDKDLKKAAEETAAEFGLPLGTMINALVREVTRSKELRLTGGLTPTPHLRKILDRADKDLKDGRNISPKFSSAKDAIAYLRS